MTNCSLKDAKDPWCCTATDANDNYIEGRFGFCMNSPSCGTVPADSIWMTRKNPSKRRGFPVWATVLLTIFGLIFLATASIAVYMHLQKKKRLAGKISSYSTLPEDTSYASGHTEA